MRAEGKHSKYVVHTVTQIKIRCLKFDSSGFDLGEVENVVHDFQERFR